MISKSFGHEERFTVGLVLLGIIFWAILGFGPSKYLGPYGDSVKFREYSGKLVPTRRGDRFEFEEKPKG